MKWAGCIKKYAYKTKQVGYLTRFTITEVGSLRPGSERRKGIEKIEKETTKARHSTPSLPISFTTRTQGTVTSH